MNSQYRITLDVARTASQYILPCFQGDTSRSLHIIFCNKGKTIELTKNDSAVIRIKKPDGTLIYNSCVINLNDNAVEYDFTEQTTSASGMCDCQIDLISDSVCFSPMFTILVSDNVVNPRTIISKDEFTALTDRIREADNLGITLEEVEGGYDAILTVTHKDGSTEQVTIPKGGLYDIALMGDFYEFRFRKSDGTEGIYKVPTDAVWGNLKPVAFSGSYNDLLHKPGIPTADQITVDYTDMDDNESRTFVDVAFNLHRNEILENRMKAEEANRRLDNLTADNIPTNDGTGNNVHQSIFETVRSVAETNQRVTILENTPHVDTNTTYTFQKIQFGGVDNILITPSEGNPTRIPIPAGMTRSEVNGAIESATTDIKEDLSRLTNSDKSATSGKVWMTTESGAQWADAPQGGTVDAYTKIESDNKYQTKGDYALSSDIPSDDHINELIENALGTSVALTAAILEVL